MSKPQNREDGSRSLQIKFIKDLEALKKMPLDEKLASKRLEALLHLYSSTQSEIQFRQKRGDDAVIPVYTLLVAMLGIQALDKIFDINFLTMILAFSIPIISLTGIQRGNQEHKMRAAAQGYASFLENQINLYVGSSIALWNIAYLDRYIAAKPSNKGKLKTSQLLTIIGSLAPVFLGIILAVRTIDKIKTGGALLWGFPHAELMIYGVFVLYFGIMIAIIIRECMSFVKNEKIRRTSAYYPIDEEIPFPARLLSNQESSEQYNSLNI